jgi:hypothetical protein
MALFIPGMHCRLCGEAIESEDDAKLFPLFTGNEADPLFIFSDAVTHKTCFEQDPRHDFASLRLADFSASQKKRPRICLVCGLQIASPDDFFGVGHLTDAPESALYKWNYAQFHRSCLPHWAELPRFIQLGVCELKAGRWRGKAMEQLIDEMRLSMPDKVKA